MSSEWQEGMVQPKQNSNVLGENWLEVSIADLCKQVYSGGTPKSTVQEYFENGVIPWLKTKEVNYSKITETENFITAEGLKNSSVKLVPVNSVIVAMYGNGDTAGRVAINKIELTTNQACCNLVVDSKRADYRFVYYYLKSQYSKLVDLKNGGAQQNLNAKLIKDYPILVPPIEEQKDIGAFLEALDDRVALLRETNATLEAMAQALFKSWFVDFDPVHANAGTQAATLPTELQTLFPATFTETPQGLVPAGWSFVNLGELVCNQSTTFKFAGVDEVVFVNTGDVAEGIFLHKNYSPVQGLPGQAKKAIQKDDILFSEIRPKNKRFAYVNIDPKDYVVSTKFMVLRAISDFAPRYIYQILKQDATIDFFNMIAESRSGTFPQITFDSIQSYQVLKPSKACVDLFIDIIQPIIDRIDSISEQAQTLATLRDALLPRLISGQLELPEIDYLNMDAV